MGKRMVELSKTHKFRFDKELEHLCKLIVELEQYRTETVRDTMREFIRSEIQTI